MGGTAGSGLHAGSWGCLRLGAAEASGPGPAAGPQRAEPGCPPAGLWAAAVSLRRGSISAWRTPGPTPRPALVQPHLLRSPSLSSPTLSPPLTPKHPEAAFYPETKVPSSSPGPLSAVLPLGHRHSPRVFQQEPGHNPCTRADGGDACREMPSHSSPALATWTSPMGKHTGAFKSPLPAGTRAF